MSNSSEAWSSSVARVRASRDSAPLEEFGRDAPKAASFANPEEDSAGRLARAAGRRERCQANDAASRLQQDGLS